jgi:hypothetical protein
MYSLPCQKVEHPCPTTKEQLSVDLQGGGFGCLFLAVSGKDPPLDWPSMPAAPVLTLAGFVPKCGLSMIPSSSLTIGTKKYNYSALCPVHTGQFRVTEALNFLVLNLQSFSTYQGLQLAHSGRNSLIGGLSVPGTVQSTDFMQYLVICLFRSMFEGFFTIIHNQQRAIIALYYL